MFLILISCNNSILPGRFYFTDKRLCVSPPASRPRPPQSARSIPTQGALSAWTFANRSVTLPPSRDAVSFSIHFPIKGSFKSARCRRSSALDSTPRTLPRFRSRFDSERPLHNFKHLRNPLLGAGTRRNTCCSLRTCWLISNVSSNDGQSERNRESSPGATSFARSPARGSPDLNFAGADFFANPSIFRS